MVAVHSVIGCGAPASADDLAAASFRIRADKVSVDETAGVIRAEGHVHAILPDRDVVANIVICDFHRDPATGEITITRFSAPGEVVVTAPYETSVGKLESRISGKDLLLDRTAEGGTGVVNDAELAVTRPGLTPVTAFFRGSRIQISERGPQSEAVIINARFTTCDRDPPHFEVAAREIKITPGQSVIARHAAIFLFGHKMISVPSLRFGLSGADSGGESFLPRIGAGKTSGLYLRWSYDLEPEHPGKNDILLQYSSRRAPTVRLRAQGAGILRPFFTVAAKEEQPGRRTSGVVLSTLPQVGMVFDSKHWRAVADYAYYRESPSSAHAHRRNIEFVYQAPIDQLSPHVSLGCEGAVRRSWYSTGAQLDAAWGRVWIQRDFRPNLSGLLAFSQVWTNHDTPFIFDDYDTETAVGVGIARDWRKWHASLLLTYDLEQGEIYSVNAAVGKDLHCLSPRLTYSSRDRSIGIDVGLVGLTTRPRFSGFRSTTVEPTPSGPNSGP